MALTWMFAAYLAVGLTPDVPVNFCANFGGQLADPVWRYVTVKEFDVAEGTATVAVRFGRGKRPICFRNILTNAVETRGVHAPLPLPAGAGQAQPFSTPEP
jgi:hypothetical protein